MSQNLLQIVQTICDELGLNRPAVVVNSTDTQIRQIYSLVSRSLRELQQNYDWTALQTEYNLYVNQPSVLIGNVTQGSYQITNLTAATNIDFNTDFNNDFDAGAADTSFIQPGQGPLWVVSAQGLPVATRIVSVNSATTVTINEPATTTATGVYVTFSQDTYPEPVDFSRFINQTWWDRTNRWALMGPDSPQVDQWHRSGIVTIGPRRHFRQIGFNVTMADFNNDFNNDFNSQAVVRNYRIWPAPGATDTPLDLVYEYISANAILNINGGFQSHFTTDSDIPILDSNMIILDTKWRLWQIKGFDYLPLQMEARDYQDRCYANDGGAKTLTLSRGNGGFGLSTGLVQDGNYPGPGTSGV